MLQLRLDFNQFMISGPSTSSATMGVTKILNGNPVAAGGTSATTHTQCLTDTFSVTNPGGITPPTICGTNTGEHSKEGVFFKIHGLSLICAKVSILVDTGKQLISFLGNPTQSLESFN